MSWFDILLGAPLDLCMAYLVCHSVMSLIRSAKAVRAGLALPAIHLFIAGAIAAAIYQIKDASFGLAAVSLGLAIVSLFLLTKTRHQSQLMGHLLDGKAVGEETQWKIVRIYGLMVGATALFLALVSMATYSTVLCAVTAGVFIEFGAAATLYLRPRRDREHA
jgi:hypothetical protein